MDAEAAISRLPETYAAALRLRARGYDDAGIAATLGLEPEAATALLRIARAKLSTLLAAGPAGIDAEGRRE